jgi:hypothetical protein
MNEDCNSAPVDRRIRLRIAKGEKHAYRRVVAGGLMPDEDVFKLHSELQVSYNLGETWEPIPEVWVGRFHDA